MKKPTDEQIESRIQNAFYLKYGLQAEEVSHAFPLALTFHVNTPDRTFTGRLTWGGMVNQAKWEEGGGDVKILKAEKPPERQPLWQKLNDDKTPGRWTTAYGDASKAFGIYTERMVRKGIAEHPICLFSPVESLHEIDKANAEFTVLAANNLASLAEALAPFVKLAEAFAEGLHVEKSGPVFEFNRVAITHEDLRAAAQAIKNIS